jgi:glycosyltransferase involved in cell wall biosynthesis
MVALEAWALGKPVLANGKCEVLRGQCIRSQAGLYYETAAEFIETLRAMFDSRSLNAAFSANGRRFFQRHYSWPVIEQKYLDILAELKDQDARGAAVRAKWRKELPPANDVLAGLPSGPVLN